jgi:hypothetical protein
MSLARWHFHLLCVLVLDTSHHRRFISSQGLVHNLWVVSLLDLTPPGDVQLLPSFHILPCLYVHIHLRVVGILWPGRTLVFRGRLAPFYWLVYFIRAVCARGCFPTVVVLWRICLCVTISAQDDLPIATFWVLIFCGVAVLILMIQGIISVTSGRMAFVRHQHPRTSYHRMGGEMFFKFSSGNANPIVHLISINSRP